MPLLYLPRVWWRSEINRRAGRAAVREAGPQLIVVAVLSTLLYLAIQAMIAGAFRTLVIEGMAAAAILFIVVLARARWSSLSARGRVGLVIIAGLFATGGLLWILIARVDET